MRSKTKASAYTPPVATASRKGVDRPRPLWSALLRSPWLWVAAVVALITSPMLFLSALVVGLTASIVGGALWCTRRRAWLLAGGMGLVLGALPYSLAALRALNP
jgi:hypothetical protein